MLIHVFQEFTSRKQPPYMKTNREFSRMHEFSALALIAGSCEGALIQVALRQISVDGP